MAVLNANYVKKRLEALSSCPTPADCLHECVFSGNAQKALGVRTLDIAKRLLDYGFHAPTIYFPLIVQEALMIEPTETESLETLDAFCEALLSIAREAKEHPELVTFRRSVRRWAGSTRAKRPGSSMSAALRAARFH